MYAWCPGLSAKCYISEIVKQYHRAPRTTLVDPDTPDPDPAFQVNPDPNPIQIHGFDDQKLKKKKIQLRFVKIFLFIKKCNSQATGEALSRKKKHPALQNT